MARRLRLHHSVGLVLAGFALAISSVGSGLPLTKHIPFTFFLPHLVFEASIHIPWVSLRRDMIVVTIPASLGGVAFRIATSAGMQWLAG